MDKNISPQESLSIITGIIQEARQRYEENGLVFMVWGISIALVASAQFYLMWDKLESISGFPYLALILPGIFTGIYYSRKGKGSPKRANPISRIMKFVWLALALNLFILGFGFFFKLGYNIIPVIMILQGLGLILSGSAIRNRIFLGAGVLTQVLAYVGFFTAPLYQPLLLAGMGIFALFIPGYALYRAKKQNHV